MGRSIHILLIEPSGQHLESFYSQIIMLLSSGCRISAGLCRQSYKTDLISSIQNRVKFIIRKNKEPVFFFLLRLQIHALFSATDLIVFNSLEKFLHKLLYLCFFWFIPVAGIAHRRCEKVNKSGMIDNLIEFKMANTVYVGKLNGGEMIKNRGSKKVSFFYPIHARDFLRTRNIGFGRFENQGSINIGFFGNNGFTSEDYLGMIEKISSIDVMHRNRMEITIACKLEDDCHKIITDKLAEKKLSGKVLYINKIRCYEEFYRMAGRLHFLVPVVKSTKCGAKFHDQPILDHEISMALTLKKPLILSDNFQLELSLHPIAVFYPDESIKNGIVTALEMQSDKYYKICSNFSNLDEASEEMQLLLYRKMLRSSLNVFDLRYIEEV